MGYQGFRTAVQCAAIASCLLIAANASAYQTTIYRIGNGLFALSLRTQPGEYFTDESVAIYVTIARATAPDRIPDLQSPRTEFIPNVESTLRAEVSFGDQRQTFPLHLWQFNNIPSGGLGMIPTVAGVYTFRLSGTINTIPVDLQITCDPATSHTGQAREDRTPREISEGVTQLFSAGSIACPKPRSANAFPGGIASNEELQRSIRELDDALGQTREELSVLPLGGSRAVPYIALAGGGISFAALLVALIALWRTRSRNQLPY